MLFLDGSFHDFNVDRVIPPVINALPAAEKQKLPLILWWNNFTGEKGKIKRCFEGDCFFSVNKSYYDHELTKAFLFYGTDLNVDELPLPRKGMSRIIIFFLISSFYSLYIVFLRL